MTRAARVLGVHPNTIRAWSDDGRIRYYRINPRGDRRYRLGDLQRFLSAAAAGPEANDVERDPLGRHRRARGGADRGIASTERRGRGQPGSARRAGERTATDQRPPGRAVDGTEPGIPGPGRAVAAIATGLAKIAISTIGSVTEPEVLLGSATRLIRETASHRLTSVWRLDGDRCIPVGVSGPSDARLAAASRATGVLATALDRPGVVEVGPPTAPRVTTGVAGQEVASAITVDGATWGALVAVVDPDRPVDAAVRSVIAAAASAVSSVVAAAAAATEVSHRLHRAEALRRVAADIGSQLDLDQILARLVEHALVLLGGDRAAVLLDQPDGSRRCVASRGLSEAYLGALTPARHLPLTDQAIASGEPVFVVGFRDDPRAAAVRAAVVQEGFDTVCVAPLFDGTRSRPLGALNVYHDRRHPWSEDELESIRELATQASIAIRTAKAYAQVATWAAQLQSIQQLGARLSHLATVEEIGAAIASELRELIDYHNVRVYRTRGDDLVPVAMQGQVGEYFDETPEQLRVRVGSGITGWVAEHRLAQVLHDAAADPRANTIPGTEADLDESMLLAPMLYEDEVLGVLVLSKLGLGQFREDDLRLLEIYASFAAQAMANADATDRLRRQSETLERQVRGQRELLEITESILTMLDVRSVLEAVADRLGRLVGWDNVAVELLDPVSGILAPVVAKGDDAAEYMKPWEPGETGLATWVVEHNQPALVEDEFDDPRVLHFSGTPIHGTLIAVPLRGRDRAIGVLTLERTGEGRAFSSEEFDLVQLFAAQVSIALQNAQAHGAVARRAETDDLTGLMNHGAFRARLAAAVEVGAPFTVLMIDLDRFKLVNDTFGHEAGNQVLKRMATAVASASRDADAVFRYGGDEFAVILAGTDADHAGPVAERIRTAVASVVGPNASTALADLHLDASAGMATYPHHGTTPDEILLAADRACFVAKRDGGGRVASAEEGEALAGEMSLQVPTPIDFAAAGVATAGP